jgi:hypothetical protein
MQYRRVGKWGLKLPENSLGLWHNFGGTAPLERSREIVRRAFELGRTSTSRTTTARRTARPRRRSGRSSARTSPATATRSSSRRRRAGTRGRARTATAPHLHACPAEVALPDRADVGAVDREPLHQRNFGCGSPSRVALTLTPICTCITPLLTRPLDINEPVGRTPLRLPPSAAPDLRYPRRPLRDRRRINTARGERPNSFVILEPGSETDFPNAITRKHSPTGVIQRPEMALAYIVHSAGPSRSHYRRTHRAQRSRCCRANPSRMLVHKVRFSFLADQRQMTTLLLTDVSHRSGPSLNCHDAVDPDALQELKGERGQLAVSAFTMRRPLSWNNV